MAVTTNKSLTKPANGSYVDNWDVPVNSNSDIIDSALGGVLSLNITSGSATLSAAQYQNLTIKVSGTGSAVTYQIPTVGGQWIVINTTSVNVTMTAGGSDVGVVIPGGTTYAVVSDGTTMRFSTDVAAGSAATIAATLASKSIVAGAGMTVAPADGKLSNTTNTLTVEQATAAEYRSATANKFTTPANVWASINSEIALTDAATVAWDMSAGFDFILLTTSAVGATRQMGVPTNIKVGQKGRLIIQQDATGSRAVTWNGVFKFASATAPVLSTAANSIDVLYYDVRDTNYIIITLAGRNFTP